MRSRMHAADLLVYLRLFAPLDMSYVEIRNLVAIRRAHGRPLGVRAYAAIHTAIAEHESGPPAG